MSEKSEPKQRDIVRFEPKSLTGRSSRLVRRGLDMLNPVKLGETPAPKFSDQSRRSSEGSGERFAPFQSVADQATANASEWEEGCPFKLYSNDRDVPKDAAEAVQCYRKAAEQGDAVAQFSLGWMYYQGRGVERNYGRAIVWFRKAADQGHAPAQTYLGWAYKAGNGVPKNHDQATLWFRKAAEEGEPLAQFLLRSRNNNFT